MSITLLQHRPIVEMLTAVKLLSPFLVDRSNGRVIVLRLSSSVCLYSVRNVLWLNGAS